MPSFSGLKMTKSKIKRLLSTNNQTKKKDLKTTKRRLLHSNTARHFKPFNLRHKTIRLLPPPK